MYKTFILFLALLISSVSAQSVKKVPPKEGTPEAFVVNFVKKINSSSMTFEEFYKEVCSEKMCQQMGEKILKGKFEGIKSLDLSKRFEYKTKQENNRVRVKIKTGVKNKTTIRSSNFNVIKINGLFQLTFKVLK